MAGLGDLVVNLSANTQKFDKNISKSQGGLKSFGTAALSALNPVTAAFTAMAAGAVGLGAAVWGITSRFGELAAVTDKAVQTGLSGAFLQQLTYAADMSGVSAETLTGGIKKLTIVIGQAAKGSKSAAEGLSDIGLSAKDLLTLSPEQQFQKVVEGISKIPSAAGKAAAAVKIFGKSGIEMTGLFAGGLDDITKLMQDAKDIGIGLDDEQLAKVAAADDALQKMYASIGAMVDQVAVGLAPAFEQVATGVTGLIGPVTKLFDTFNSMDDKWRWLGDTMVAAFDVAIETIKVHWQEMIADLLTSTSEFGMSMADFTLAITNPTEMALRAADMAFDANARQAGGEDGLQVAQNRLAGLLGKFQEQQGITGKGMQPGFNRPWMELKPPKSFTEAWAGITDKLSPITSQLEMGAQGMFDRAKIQAEAAGNMLSNWLGTPAEKKLEPQLAGAMQAGSVEAYSTLVQAMMTRGKDPVVAATEKQTKDLIQGLKPKREFKNIESFVSL